MKPTLLILAAGMGSRYGGLKQLDGIGPGGETIMEYSVYDAMRAGFGKVVFVIRPNFADAFRETFIPRLNGKVPYEIVYQEIEFVPEGCVYAPERTKPWGTNHAVMMGAEVIREPFAVINADDYYGVDSFKVMADFLSNLGDQGGRYCMVGFNVGNTLSEIGAVSRGVCEKDTNGFLTTVVERTHIERKDGVIGFADEQGQWVSLREDTPVSMNMWGFTPDYFDYSRQSFISFLQKNGQNIKAEFFIPLVVNEMIQSGKASVKVLSTSSRWFGVTYQEDRPGVVARLSELHQQGVYPPSLW